MPFSGDSPEVVLRKIDTIAALAERRGPQLVIAHLLLPHEPYIFRADCTPRTPYWPVADGGVDAPRWRAAYVEQIQCTNELLVSLVGRILERSARPPVILIQSDHGHGGIYENSLRGLTIPMARLTPTAIQDRTSVFAAYYLPRMPHGVVSDSITPINLFPMVLNYYWGEHLPLQPNRVSWSDFQTPYSFVVIPRNDSIVH